MTSNARGQVFSFLFWRATPWIGVRLSTPKETREDLSRCYNAAMETASNREVMCGDFPDLELEFVERMRALRQRDPLAPHVVLVPTNLLRRHLAAALTDRGVPHINV